MLLSLLCILPLLTPYAIYTGRHLCKMVDGPSGNSVPFADPSSSSTTTARGFTPNRTSRDGSRVDKEKTISDDGGTESRPVEEAGFKLEDDEFPENSVRAYFILVGVTCICIATMGYVSSWGACTFGLSNQRSELNTFQIFQAYYEETILRDSSPSAIALIGSIQYSLLPLPALIVGRLFDIGYFHSVFLPSSILLVAATFLTAQCTQYWQFLLCQGLAVGLACGGIYGSRPPILAHWFKKKRGRALGFTGMGASVSSTVLPIAARKLIPQVGFPWTMRIFGFIMFVTLGISNLTLRRRLQPQKVEGGMLHLAAFREIPYTVYCVSSLLVFLGLYTALTYVDVSATDLGSTRELALYFVAIANAGSFFGRWVSGLLADRLGPLNITTPFAFCAAILTYSWPFTRSTTSLIVVTVIYGFSSGAYATLFSAPVMNLGKEGDVGRRVGMSMTFVALGSVLGPPISGAIYKKTGGFVAAGLFAGSVMVIGVGCMVVVRCLVLGKWAGRV